jgi:hypothetical protein
MKNFRMKKEGIGVEELVEVIGADRGGSRISA